MEYVSGYKGKMKTNGKEQFAELYKKINKYVDDFDYTEKKIG